MIPNYQDLHAQASGVTDSGAFKISLNHSAHIMKILRDQLYSDKKMAVLREYSANAWDANREAGNGDKPIKVTLPTVMDPTLTIRDYGPGISHKDVFEIYAQYGESTKRTKNGQVGMLGIGSKSGFAYTDSFTVTTWQEGIQRIYTALLDSGAGSMNLLDASPSDEPTGTMIQIPVRPNDIPEFEQKAQKLFIHFKPRPDINTTLPPELPPEVVMQHGTISQGQEDWYAVMGCIAYKIDLDQLRGLNAHRGGAGEFLDRLHGYLYFNIGDVEIAASREGLEYSDKTKAALIDKFIDLIDEFVKQTLDNIEKGDFSFWEKRCRAQVLNALNLPVPKIFSHLTDERFNIGDPKTFTVTYGQKQAAISHIHVDSKTRLIIRDEIRRVDGYGLSGFDYVIRPKKDIAPAPTLDEVRAELQAIIEEKKVVGVPVVNISTITWHQKAKFVVAPIKVSNKKHTVRTFVLADDDRYSNPYSDHWEIETITPTDKDVFVLLRKFKIIDEPDDDDGNISFYSQYTKDRAIIKALKFKMPKVYGYKSTKKDPVKLDTIQGKKYDNWRIEFFDSMTQDPKVKPVFDAMEWVELIVRSHRHYSYRDSDKLDPQIVAEFFKALGRDHEICQLFRKVMAAKRNLKKIPGAILEGVRGLRKVLAEAKGDDAPKSEAQEFREKLEEAYPMFRVIDSDQGIATLLEINEDGRNKLIEYIKLVDRAKKGLNNGEGTVAHSNGRVDHDRLEGQAARSEEGGAQLQQPEERNHQGEGGRGLEQDRGPSVGDQDGQGVVERQVRPERGFGDLLRAASA